MHAAALMSETELFNTLPRDLGIVPFAARLLRYCHGRDEEYHAHTGDRAVRRAEAETFYQADDILRDGPGAAPSLQARTAEVLLRLLLRSRASHPRIPLVFHASAIARVLGHRRRDGVLTWFHRKYETLPLGERIYVPAPLDPIPVVPWRAEADPKGDILHELVSGSPAFNPENTDDHCDRTECLRLMPAHSSIAVEYDFSPLDCLPPLGHSGHAVGPAEARLVGIGSFGGFRRDYAEQYSLGRRKKLPSASVNVLRRHPAGPFPSDSLPTLDQFFPVTPLPPTPPLAPRIDLIGTLMRLAGQAGLSVFVLPELSGTGEDLKEAIGWFEGGTMETVRLFVAGSAHVAGAHGARENGLYAGLRSYPAAAAPMGPVRRQLDEFIAGVPRNGLRSPDVLHLRHSKLGRFTFREGQQTCEEGIDRARGVRVYVSRTCTFVLMICLDFLLQAATDLLAALGTNLVLVSAFSAESSEFEAAASFLCMKNQALIAVAITGPLTQPGAVFARPARQDHLVRVSHSDGPSVIRFDPYDGFWRRIRP
jgi:hypothetical protein